MKHFRVFRVDRADRTDHNSYVVYIDPNGIENPDDPRDLLILYLGRQRTATFRDQEWNVTGVIKKLKLKLWQEDY